VIDRLSAYLHWRDRQSWEQAIMVCKSNPIDWNDIADWAINEQPRFNELDQLRAECEKCT
jgi:hypothetical protein